MLVEADCASLACLSAGWGFKAVAEPFGLDFDELESAASAGAARPAELFLARRTQALSSAHARLVSAFFAVDWLALGVSEHNGIIDDAIPALRESEQSFRQMKPRTDWTFHPYPPDEQS